MSWDSFKDVASGRVNKHQVWRQATEKMIIQEANDLLSSFFGTTILNTAQAIYFKNKVLSFAILEDKSEQEITKKRAEFIEALNQKFQAEVVEDLYFLH